MLKLQERVNNPENESDEFYLSLPHYKDTLTTWSSEYDVIRKEYNETSFSDYTTKILELEYKLEYVTPRWHPQLARDLLYHWETTELWYLKDKTALKYVAKTLPDWDGLKQDTRLIMSVFR